MDGTAMIYRALVVFAATASLLASGPAGAEEGAIRVWATWEADVEIVPTGLSEMTMAGTIFGHVFVDTDQGPISFGDMKCPVLMRQDLKSMAQGGEGRCTIERPKGDLWFLTFSCTGVSLVDCAGESKLTGGTGPFEKVTGGGHFVARGNMMELLQQNPNPKGRIKIEGTIFWPELHYKTP